MREWLNDTDNRVVGNAFLGLHLMGEPAAARQAEQMLLDARPNFRRAAAWVMGRIGKPEFVKSLARAAQEDEDPGVRETGWSRARTVPDAPKAASAPPPSAEKTSVAPDAATEAAPEGTALPPIAAIETAPEEGSRAARCCYRTGFAKRQLCRQMPLSAAAEKTAAVPDAATEAAPEKTEPQNETFDFVPHFDDKYIRKR
jgi:hypothetical protein